MQRTTQLLARIGLTATLIVATSIAWGGGDSSGGGGVRKQKAAFDKLSPYEAFYSDQFDKQVPNIWISEWSSAVRATSSLCIEDGEYLRSAYRHLTCETWRVDLRESEFGKRYRDFEIKSQARDKAEGSNGRGKPYCVDGYYEYRYADLERRGSTYTVRFFAKTPRRADRRASHLEVGKHEYQFADCDQFPSFRPDGKDAEEVQMAGGESSGGGGKKKRRL